MCRVNLVVSVAELVGLTLTCTVVCLDKFVPNQDQYWLCPSVYTKKIIFCSISFDGYNLDHLTTKDQDQSKSCSDPGVV